MQSVSSSHKDWKTCEKLEISDGVVGREKAVCQQVGYPYLESESYYLWNSEQATNPIWPIFLI